MIVEIGHQTVDVPRVLDMFLNSISLAGVVEAAVNAALCESVQVSKNVGSG